MTDYTPKPEHKFTVGLWTVGNIGRDPFGGPVRDGKTPVSALDPFTPGAGSYTPEKAAALKAQPFDRSELGKRGFSYERLDQLPVQILLGAR